MNRERTEFYVYAISSGSLDSCPNNSLHTFTNVLSHPLEFPDFRSWQVGLTSISCSNQVVVSYNSDFTVNLQKFVKVKCDLVNSSFSEPSVLTFHNFKPYTEDYTNHHYHEPSNVEYYPIRTPVIDRLSLSLANQQNQTIKFAPSQPTIVVLHFRKMENKLFFFSRVSSRNDKNGQANSFKASLPPQIGMDPNQRMEVSLNSITYNKQIRANSTSVPYPQVTSIHRSWKPNVPLEEDSRRNTIVDFDFSMISVETSTERYVDNVFHYLNFVFAVFFREKSRYLPGDYTTCLLYTSPSPRDQRGSRMPSSA